MKKAAIEKLRKLAPEVEDKVFFTPLIEIREMPDSHFDSMVDKDGGPVDMIVIDSSKFLTFDKVMPAAISYWIKSRHSELEVSEDEGSDAEV
uniref:Uncharacterized protein n=1 Tax=viral metagenome TaxID=1070528 RepID=A0A6M3LXN6_9ZZZZ